MPPVPLILRDGPAEYNADGAPGRPYSVLCSAPTQYLACWGTFRYRAATRVDTLGGNAGEGREFAAFDIFGACCGGNPRMLQKTRKEKP